MLAFVALASVILLGQHANGAIVETSTGFVLFDNLVVFTRWTPKGLPPKGSTIMAVDDHQLESLCALGHPSQWSRPEWADIILLTGEQFFCGDRFSYPTGSFMSTFASLVER